MLTAGLDLLAQGVTVFDQELRLVACNRTFLKLLDFPARFSRPGTCFEQFIRYNAERGEYGPGDPEGQVAERVAAARAFKVHETLRRRPNGRLLSIHGFPLPHRGFIALYSDVTEQERQREELACHQAELEQHIQRRTAELTSANAELTAAIEANRKINAALQHSEGRLRQITDAIPAHIAYFDHTWTYRYANRRYARWFGWSAESLVGKPILEVVGSAVFALVEEHVRRSLGGEKVTYEYPLVAPSGATVYARSTLLPDFGPDGKVQGCYVHAVDVTEQRRTHFALAQAQKLEAIGQLTGGLAHDFNNMLTVVMGSLSGLRDGLPGSALVEEYVDPALEAAGRGAELIKRLLAFSRQQPMDPRPVDVNELVLGMAKLIRRSLPGSISLLTSSSHGDLIVEADPHQFESALLNLVLNAKDAMPDGGSLCVDNSVARIDGAGAADLELEPGEYVRIAVTDSGTGMDAKTLARVFEPFFTTKKFGSGSGLGMAMVYGFIKQSGGGVRIDSRPAAGTTVALLLPRCGHAAAGVDLRSDRSDAATVSLDGRVVLLVEDDPEVRKVVRHQLSALGCSVLEAESGSEAADMVETITAISLVLSDVVMPGSMDGRALARFVRRFRPELPVLLMSGYAEQGAKSALDGVGTPLLDKPFSREQLAEALRALVG
ncbi:MAG: PAS-domain containing protein [Rhodocyclaceae bacterium]|nr:PAS-domain containing protein [Rhodocyclaceae bacterium]